MREIDADIMSVICLSGIIKKFVLAEVGAAAARVAGHVSVSLLLLYGIHISLGISR